MGPPAASPIRTSPACAPARSISAALWAGSAAITSAVECAELNDVSDLIDIRQVDLEREATVEGQPFSLILANLTGGMLVRLAERLCGLLLPGCTLIVTGVTLEGEDAVTRAFEEQCETGAGRRAEDECGKARQAVRQLEHVVLRAGAVTHHHQQPHRALHVAQRLQREPARGSARQARARRQRARRT